MTSYIRILLVLCSSIALSACEGFSTDIETDTSDGSSGAPNNPPIVDVTPPATPTISSPANNSTRSQAAFSLVGGCETSATVQVTGNIAGSMNTGVCANSSYSIPVTVTSGSGAKVLQVSQTDAAGNTSPARQWTINLSVADTTAPSAPTITSPANNSSVSQAAVTLVGTCETAATVRVSGSLSGSAVTSNCSNSAFAIPITLSNGNGAKNLQVIQTDAAGNASAASSLVLNLNVPDTSAPSAPTITSPANNSTVSQAAVTITGACETSATVRVSGNITGTNNTVTCASSNYSMAVTLSSGNGSKNIQVVQTDPSGNVSSPRSLTINLNIVTTPAPSDPNWTSRNDARVFLSGHSLTDNPLIDYVQGIALSNNDNFNYNQQIVIGSPMRVRTKGDNNASGWPGYSEGKNKSGGGMNIINEIRNPQTIGSGRRYDTLVITENHNSIEQINWENTIPYLRHYHDLLRSGSSSARTLFYHSWLDINKSNPNPWITHEKNARTLWECVVSKVNNSLNDSSSRPQVQSLPTGAALVDLVERAIANQVNGLSGASSIDRLNQIFSDNVHLTNLGAYYASLVTYSAVFRKSAAGTAAPAGISATLASSLQTIAWNYVNTYYAQSSPGVHTMSYCRSQASNYCTSYWTLKGQTGNISGCTGYFGGNGGDNPFRDANFTPFPAP